MALRDFSRHMRGYLWISFLVAIFLLMAMSENGIFENTSILPNPVLIPKDNQYPIPTNGLFQELPTASSRPTGILEVVSETAQIVKETSRSKEASEIVKEKDKEEEKELVFNGLSPKDVVILVKTGATSLWRRMPGHSRYPPSTHPHF